MRDANQRGLKTSISQSSPYTTLSGIPYTFVATEWYYSNYNLKWLKYVKLQRYEFTNLSKILNLKLFDFQVLLPSTMKHWLSSLEGLICDLFRPTLLGSEGLRRYNH